jgi:hypothetical protein
LSCTRPLDALDLEALASGEEPVLASDGRAHAAACPDCSRRLQAFRALDDWLADVSLPAVPEGFADGIERLRGFSPAESRSWRLWKVPAAIFAGLIAGSGFLLSFPALGAAEQAGFLAALALECKSLFLWPLSVARSLPAAVSTLSDVLLRDRPFAAVSILLMLPAGFAVTRLWARHAIRK